MTQNVNELLTDEKLSAFLDSELPEHEMKLIRDQLADDEDLVIRLAELASVDAIVSATYHDIDEVPLPESIQKLVADNEHLSQANDTVVDLSLWRRAKSAWQAQAPLATAAALVLGLAIGLLTQVQDTHSTIYWPQITTALDDHVSGQSITLAEGYQLTARVSFMNSDQQLCRQFVLQTPENSQHSIACHDGNSWQLEATLFDEPIKAGSYQTASSQKPINSLVESMAAGTFLNAEQEQEAIDSGWAQPLNH
ncbi:anti-sigma factor family protein [Kangiella koreensis]|uniref:Putative transmembrane anti-sigma factor n=1 Tax=Kangiella koreensis (strain DSM 16069 / JCM 12317 / KCTC 12182 / SW-125) TaxID=523791 RepID=C7R619_KANKD|nr:hypothetical protein [Kangiella koreensis]ACV25450.1 putative transmembrane anti-sigma factor [Kangiella koreensis DSM 16069]